MDGAHAAVRSMLERFPRLPGPSKVTPEQRKALAEQSDLAFGRRSSGHGPKVYELSGVDGRAVTRTQCSALLQACHFITSNLQRLQTCQVGDDVTQTEFLVEGLEAAAEGAVDVRDGYRREADEAGEARSAAPKPRIRAKTPKEPSPAVSAAPTDPPGDGNSNVAVSEGGLDVEAYRDAVRTALAGVDARIREASRRLERLLAAATVLRSESVLPDADIEALLDPPASGNGDPDSTPGLADIGASREGQVSAKRGV